MTLGIDCNLVPSLGRFYPMDFINHLLAPSVSLSKVAPSGVLNKTIYSFILTFGLYHYWSRIINSYLKMLVFRRKDLAVFEPLNWVLILNSIVFLQNKLGKVFKTCKPRYFHLDHRNDDIVLATVLLCLLLAFRVLDCVCLHKYYMYIWLNEWMTGHFII